jgi:hypothetical protein
MLVAIVRRAQEKAAEKNPAFHKPIGRVLTSRSKELRGRDRR